LLQLLLNRNMLTDFGANALISLVRLQTGDTPTCTTLPVSVAIIFYAR
jgi:hypothetical protein